jgi:hypothetical protein
MIGRPFKYKGHTGNVKSIRYEVGNPMGFYSS